jgi:crooked neck
VPRQQITDVQELTHFRMRKRKEYEDSIRMQRQHIGTWIKYAAWEESQAEFARARSIYERALGVEYTNQSLWLRYAEMEMRNKYVNHARNVWDRAVALLPRVPQFWFKYTYMEEMLGDVAKARALFERWMEWEPDDNAWAAYIKFEMRNKEPARAREVYKR